MKPVHELSNAEILDEAKKHVKSQPITMWVAPCPFQAEGFPVLGLTGSSVHNVVVMTVTEWQRLCAEVPQLAKTQFRVGTFK